MKQRKKVILLAPAGSREALSAALANGADAVYFGVGDLNMRSHAALNFQISDLPEIAAECHRHGAQAWLTVNIIAYDSEIEAVREVLDAARQAGVDAVIAADQAVIVMAAEAGLPVHISVQANVSNSMAVKFYSQWADVVVAARELTLEQIAGIRREIEARGICGPSGEPVRLEAFVHGALCIGISGRCGMSLCEYNTSSNRGKCYQPCRRAYIVTDEDTGQEFKIDNKYIMSPRDLCTIAQLPRMLEAGISVLKIEGRGRGADYVAATTRCYRQALDVWLEGKTPSREKLEEWRRELAAVFNRNFWEGGYYFGEDTAVWAGNRDSQATVKKHFVGAVTHYYQRTSVVELVVQASPLKNGDRILVTGPTTGAVQHTITEMMVDDKFTDSAAQGQTVTFKLEPKVRVNDKLFRLEERKF
ncbi:MAG: U32 family peptidase [Victivallales bacterium]|nr:U32 family peptidase [Victivallales bacterium]